MDQMRKPVKAVDQMWKPVKRVADSTLGAFGPGDFGRRAEGFAKAFGTPGFLLGQTAVVVAWIIANAIILQDGWDPYPFILLNLMFSLQAAYAAPLILLAQARQAERDRLLYEAEAAERGAIAEATLTAQQESLGLISQLAEQVESNAQLLNALASTQGPRSSDA